MCSYSNDEGYKNCQVNYPIMMLHATSKAGTLFTLTFFQLHEIYKPLGLGSNLRLQLSRRYPCFLEGHDRRCTPLLSAFSVHTWYSVIWFSRNGSGHSDIIPLAPCRMMEKVFITLQKFSLTIKFVLMWSLNKYSLQKVAYWVWRLFILFPAS